MTAGSDGSDSTGAAAAAAGGGGLTIGGMSLSALLSSVFSSGAMVALGWIVFPPLNALNAITILSAFLNIPGGISMARGDSSMPYEYSKWGARPAKGRRVVHGRAGMLAIYTLGLAASLAGLGIFLPSDTPALLRSNPKALLVALLETRTLLVAFLLWAHFTKRFAEVLLVHSYSGTMATQTAITISLAYGVSASLLQYQVAIIPAAIYEEAAVRLVKLPLPPSWGLPLVSLPVAIGLALFALGQMGNGYHHALLAALRVMSDEELNKKDEGAAAGAGAGSEGPAAAAAATKGGASKRRSKAKPPAASDSKGADAAADVAAAGDDRSRIVKQYKVPQGGLFPLVACPHYLFECMAWFGLAVVSQHVYALVTAAGMASYLMGRAYLTRQWYLKNLPDFPAERKCMIPFIF